jgi:hypothetical protein
MLSIWLTVRAAVQRAAAARLAGDDVNPRSNSPSPGRDRMRPAMLLVGILFWWRLIT